MLYIKNSFGYELSSVKIYSCFTLKVLTGVQDDRIFFKPVRKPDPPKYDSSQPEKMEVYFCFDSNLSKYESHQAFVHLSKYESYQAFVHAGVHRHNPDIPIFQYSHVNKYESYQTFVYAGVH